MGDYDYLHDVLNAVPEKLGKKFVFSHVNPDIRTYILKKALKLLNQARVCHIVHITGASGLPLKVEVGRNFFKVIFIDIGLCSAALNYSLLHIKSVEDIILINEGGLAEQVVGQLLRTLTPYYKDPELFYWIRPKKGASAEIDYIIQHNRQMVPIEVKAGATGTLKSLHLFMHEKKLDCAVRIHSGRPHISTISLKDTQGKKASYELRSIPFYLLSELHRLLD